MIRFPGSIELYPKTKLITILDHFKLQVLFDNSIAKIIDFTKKFNIDTGGYGVN